MAKEALAGPGAGASAARVVVAEAAAMRTAQAIFLISIAERENSSGDLLVSCGRDEKDGRARLSDTDPRKKGRGGGGVFIGPFGGLTDPVESS